MSIFNEMHDVNVEKDKGKSRMMIVKSMNNEGI
jgi:hypothetical protein